MLKTILAIALSMFPGFAAIQAGMHWDVRSGGSDTNGGGFDATVTSPGTDWSVQDAAHQAYTDLVIGGTTTQLTSAAHPFGTAHPGNVINITGGGGCTTGWFEVLSVSGTTATMDRSVGTGGSTCTGNLGGGLATPAKAIALLVDGNTWYVQKGTYSTTTTWSFGAKAGRLSGYQTTHDDAPTGANRPTMTTATNSTNLVSMTNNGVNLTIYHIENVIFTNTAGTPAHGITLTNSGAMLEVNNCKFSGFDIGIKTDDHDQTALVIDDTEVTSSTSHGVELGDAMRMRHCWIHGNTGAGVLGNAVASRNGSNWSVEDSVISGNTLSGIKVQGHPDVILVLRSTFYNNSRSGYEDTSGADYNLPTDMYNHGMSVQFENNIFYSNTRYGIEIHGGFVDVNRNNAYGANGIGARSNLAAGTNNVTLSGNPFNNAGSGDFGLNATAGAGAACRSVGYPDNAFGAGLSTNSYLDIGAARHQDPGAGGSGQTGYTFSLLLISLLALGAVVLRRAL